ncbi:MAG: NusG domain II-containing protein [bacterium]
MNRRNLYQVSKYDFILAGIILIFSVSSLLSFKNFRSNGGEKAFIYENGKLIKEVNLSEEKIINYADMEIEVKEGRIRVLKSDCPQKICVQTGWISKPGQTIICVPNKVLIEIVGISNAEYNAISY